MAACDLGEAEEAELHGFAFLGMVLGVALLGPASGYFAPHHLAGLLAGCAAGGFVGRQLGFWARGCAITLAGQGVEGP